MRRVFHVLGIFAACGLILASFAAAYALTGASDAQTRVYYRVELPDASAGMLDVTLTITPGPSPFIDLYLQDPLQRGETRIKDLTSTRAGRPLAHWQALPFFPNMVRVWNGFSSTAITVTYRVSLPYPEDGGANRRYPGPEFIFVRGMEILYSPLSVRDILQPDFDHPSIDAGFAEADVILPAGWTMVSPYGSGKISTPVANLRNGYFSFGPFSIQEMAIGKTPLLFGVYEGLPAGRRADLMAQIPLLFETMQRGRNWKPGVRG